MDTANTANLSMSQDVSGASIPVTVIAAPSPIMTLIDPDKKGIRIWFTFQASHSVVSPCRAEICLSLDQITKLTDLFENNDKFIQAAINSNGGQPKPEHMVERESNNWFLDLFKNIKTYAFGYENPYMMQPLLSVIPTTIHVPTLPVPISTQIIPLSMAVPPINIVPEFTVGNLNATNAGGMVSEICAPSTDSIIVPLNNTEVSQTSIMINKEKIIKEHMPTKLEDSIVESDEKDENHVEINEKSYLSMVLKTNESSDSPVNTSSSPAPHVSRCVIETVKTISISNDSIICQKIANLLKCFPYPCERGYGCKGNKPHSIFENGEQRWYKICNALHDEHDCPHGFYCDDKKGECYLIHPREPQVACHYSRINKERLLTLEGRNRECGKRLRCSFKHHRDEKKKWINDQDYVNALKRESKRLYHRFQDSMSGPFEEYPVDTGT